MIANLLLIVLQKRLKRPWAFSNLSTIVKLILMNYYDLYSFLEKPESDWINITENEPNMSKLKTLFDYGGLVNLNVTQRVPEDIL